MWVWPQVPLGGPSPLTILRLRTPSPRLTWAALPWSIAKRARGVGGRGRGRGVGLWLWLGGMGPSKGQLGPDPHLGVLDQNDYLHDLLSCELTYLIVSSREFIGIQVMQCNCPMFQGVRRSQVILAWPNLTRIYLCRPR